MNINIVNIGMAQQFDRKSDIVYGLFHAFKTLGHTPTISNNSFTRGKLNLIIGSDILVGSKQACESLFENQIPFAIYEVENFNGTTINYRKNFDIEAYKYLLTTAEFIVTPYLHNVPKLIEVVNSSKVSYAKWGFHESMQNPNITRNCQYDSDACFFGLVKGDRVYKKQILTKEHPGSVNFINENDPFTIRDYAVSQSRYGLSLSYGAADDFVNPFRLYYMSANGVPVLADHDKDDDNYLQLCDCSDFGTLLQKISEPTPRKIKDIIENAKSVQLVDQLRELL